MHSFEWLRKRGSTYSAQRLDAWTVIVRKARRQAFPAAGLSQETAVIAHIRSGNIATHPTTLWSCTPSSLSTSARPSDAGVGCSTEPRHDIAAHEVNLRGPDGRSRPAGHPSPRP